MPEQDPATQDPEEVLAALDAQYRELERAHAERQAIDEQIDHEARAKAVDALPEEERLQVQVNFDVQQALGRLEGQLNTLGLRVIRLEQAAIRAAVALEQMARAGENQ